MNVRIFDTALEKFIASLPAPTLAKTLRTIDLLKEFGSHLGLPHSRKVAPHIFELRVRGIHEVRIFFAFHSGESVLLHGYLKKSQKLPKRELETAVHKYKQLA